MSASAIIRLISSSGPTAVFGGVTLRIVKALDCVSFRRARAHVGKKQDKVAPLFADCNAARPIIGKAFAFRIAASLMHRRPYVVFGNIVSLPVGAPSAPRGFVAKTTARACSSGAKITACSVSLLTAIADAIPCALIGVIRKCDQATKTTVGDVNKDWHETSTVAYRYIGVNWPTH